MEQKVIVKWKYRECSEGKSNHNMDNYIKYMERQVEERRNNSGVHSLNENDDVIGNPEHDKAQLERMQDGDNWEQAIYLKYIDERKGSSSCFSSEGADVDALKKEVRKHEGCVWYPIVSMKESDAIEMELTTEAQWMVKARELAEEYRKTLGIEENNFHWLAAFHTKAEEDQNKQSDAGAMPHLHFMLWEEKPMRKKFTLTHEEVDKVRSKTYSIMAHEYTEKFYKYRNEAKDELHRQSLSDLTNHMEDVKSLVLDIKAITGGYGKINVKELERREQIASSILDKFDNGQKLSKTEQYYKERLNIYDKNTCKRVILNHQYVLDELESLASSLMTRDDTMQLINEWYDISMAMRSGQGQELAEKNTKKDLLEIKKQIKNAILDEVKGATKENRYISPKLRGQLMEKLNEGTYKPNVDLETFKNTTMVIAALQKVAGISEEEAYKQQQELLQRSQEEEYEAYLEELIKEVYDRIQFGFDVTSRDYWAAMKAIRVPIAKQESQFQSLASNSYQMASNVILQPIATQNALTINHMNTMMDSRYVKNVMNLSIADLSFMTPDQSHYEQQWNTLLDNYSACNQSILDTDYDMDEMERELHK